MKQFEYTDSNKKYHTLDYFYKNKFNSKVFKVSLNAGFTCPNIDGTAGTGGCIYCSASGSGDYAGDVNDPLVLQFNKVKTLIHQKWPVAKYIGYFQAHTNTYDKVEVLKEKYETILKLDNVIGLSIATRADAIDDEVLAYLEELNTRTFLTVELGLQTIHEKTSLLINRGHDLKTFDKMVHELSKRHINVVVHIINGLPYETKEMMIETVNYINKLPIQGIKIHMLHILKNTKLAQMYVKEPFPVLSKEEYVDVVCTQLENLRPEIVINRITGDPNTDDLIEPHWLVKKFGVLNEIDKELERRQTYQGFNLSVLNQVKRLARLNTSEKDIVVDATVGNGYDTLYLANLAKEGHTFGFDIQELAINKTKALLAQNGIKNYTLYHKNHAEIDIVLSSYVGKVSTIIFNLGYLPNGDKNITTKYDTTIKAIKGAFNLLNNKGIIIITVYPGHEEGKKEHEHLLTFLKNFKYQKYTNTNNEEAPYVITIRKMK